MTGTTPSAGVVPAAENASPPRPGPVRWLIAVVKTARPQQWPKNLLVFAAPLAGASLGRHDGFAYALVATAAFIAASSAVYFINDVADVERDRRHPTKRFRGVASGEITKTQALAVAAVCILAAEAAGFWIREPKLAIATGAYLVLSLTYSLVLKHVPVVELIFVASGFVLRALGGAAATHVPPSGWFLLVCSLGALMVATAKRFSELSVLGDEAIRHRPVMRWYTPAALRLGQRVVAIVMVAAYILWAHGEQDAWIRGWHLASAIPLAAALVRFDWLTGRATSKPVEDLISRDVPMVCCELAWLVLFAVGL
jgi:decaprenyl-phosphate phosphoribosyltransferase